jgi:hypothetical protein
MIATTAAPSVAHAVMLYGLAMMAGIQPMITAKAAQVDAWLKILMVWFMVD